MAEEEPVPVPQVFKLHLDDASEKGTHLMENCMRWSIAEDLQFHPPA